MGIQINVKHAFLVSHHTQTDYVFLALPTVSRVAHPQNAKYATLHYTPWCQTSKEIAINAMILTVICVIKLTQQIVWCVYKIVDMLL